MPQTTLTAARQVMEAVPLVMRTIRAQLRSHRRLDISVPQLRAMGYIDQNDGASLSELASFIGLSLPSISKLIDGLVARRLVTRVSASLDRRRICLSLTALGRDELRSARRSTERYLAERLAGLDQAELEALARAMTSLTELFEQEAQTSTLLNEP